MTNIVPIFGSQLKKNNTMLNNNTATPETPEVSQPLDRNAQELEASRKTFQEGQQQSMDDVIRSKGYTLPQTKKEDRQKYLDGLPDQAYNDMMGLYNKGYSFDSARFVIEQVYGKDPQSLKESRAGGAKESDTWVGKIANSSIMKLTDRVNLPGKLTEYINEQTNKKLDQGADLIKETTGVSENSNLWRESRNKKIKERLDNLSEEKVKKYYDKYTADTFRGKLIRELYGSFYNYVEEKEKTIPETILGLGTEGGDPFKGIAFDKILTNTPSSATRLLSANAYALSNPVDNALDLAWLFGTSEGRDVIKEEYGSLDKIQNTLENDPRGFISDLMDAKSLIARAKARSKQIQGLGSKFDYKGASNKVLQLAGELEQLVNKDKTPEGQVNLEIVEKTADLEDAIKKKNQAKEKLEKTNEELDKWNKLSEQADRLSDVWDKKAIDNAVIKGLSKLGPTGKGLAYWYSLTQDTGSTIWNGVSTTEEKEIEGQQTQTVDELEGKQPNIQTLDDLDNKAPRKVEVETPIVGGIKDSKPVKKITSVIDNLTNKWEERMTGMSPELKQRIQENPFVSEYWNRLKGIVDDEGLSMSDQKIEEQFIEDVGNELLRRIGIVEDQINEIGQGYQEIRDMDGTFDMTSTAQGIYDAFDREGITILPSGELQFRQWSEAMTTDRSHAQILWNLMRNFIYGDSMTASQYLDLRAQLKAIENYKKGMDPKSAGKSAMLARQLRHAINEVGHKEIPGLKELDAEYSKDAQYLRDLKRDITYQGGELSGTVRHNFFSIIRNIGTANRKKYAEIIGKIFPDLQLRVEAIRMMPKIMKSYQKNSGLLSSVLSLPKYITAGQLASGGSYMKTALSFVINQFVLEGVIKPVDANLRQSTIDHIINSLTPEGQLKLEMALSDSMLGEMTVVDKEVLDQVGREIQAYVEKYRENLPKLPSPKPDVVDEEGNVTLGRGNPIPPEKQKGDIIEINLHKPEAKEKLIQKIQEEEGVTKQEAEKIADEIDLFQELLGAVEGSLKPNEIDYNTFKTNSLIALYYDKRVPQSEKEKIMEVISERMKNLDELGVKDFYDEQNRYRAVEIDKLKEQEQRIGKVGKNKVNRQYQRDQEIAWLTNKNRILEGIGEAFGLDNAKEIQDKFDELSDKSRSFIDSYKKTEQYLTESAEREVLNKLISEWENIPEFVKNMNKDQATAREELQSKPLQNGYEFESTDYNDRYVLKENGRVINYGAIKYGKNGEITVIAQDPNGLTESGLLDNLPPDAEVMFAGENESAKARVLRGENEFDANYELIGYGRGKSIARELGLKQKNAINELTVQDFLDYYGIKVKGIEKIKVGKLREAYGKYGNGLITLADTIRESTAPHELFHAVFDMVSEKRKNRILEIIMQTEGKSRKQAEETLADSFAKYFNTGEFDYGIAPKSRRGKIKYFFKEVAKVIFGLKDSKDEIKELFDDILNKEIPLNQFSGKTKYQTTGVQHFKKASILGIPHVEVIGPEKYMTPDMKELRIVGRVYIPGSKPAGGTQFPEEALIDDYNDDFNVFVQNMRNGFTESTNERIIIGEFPLDGDVQQIGFYIDNKFGDHIEKHGAYKIEDLVELINDPDRIIRGKDGMFDYNNIFEKEIPGLGYLRGVVDSNYNLRTLFLAPKPYNEETNKGIVKYMKQEEMYEMKTEDEYREVLEEVKKQKAEAVEDIWNKLSLSQQQALYNTADPDKIKWFGDVRYRSSIYYDKFEELWNAIQDWIGANVEAGSERFGDFEGQIGNNDERLKSIIDTLVLDYTNSGYGVKFGLERILDLEKEAEASINKMMDVLEEATKDRYTRPHKVKVLDMLTDTYNPDDIEKWRKDFMEKFNEEFQNPKTPKKLKKQISTKSFVDRLWDEARIEFPKDLVDEYANPKAMLRMIEKKVDEAMERGNDNLQRHKLIEYDEEDAMSLGPIGTEVYNELGELGFEPGTSYEIMNLIHELTDVYDGEWLQENINAYRPNTAVAEDYVPLYSFKTVESNLRKILAIDNLDYLVNNPGLAEEDMEEERNRGRRALKLKEKGAYNKKERRENQKLVAVSNTSSVDYVIKTLKDWKGGLPMPSIAVTDPTIMHDDFGAIQYVFGKETVDPEADERNTLYGSDAATPTMPSILKRYVEPKDEITDDVNRLLRSLGGDFVDNVYVRDHLYYEYSNYVRDIAREVNGNNDEEELEGLKQDFMENFEDHLNGFLAGLNEQYEEDGMNIEFPPVEFEEEDLENIWHDITYTATTSETYVEEIKRAVKSIAKGGSAEIILDNIVEALPEKAISNLKKQGYSGEKGYKEAIRRDYSDLLESMTDFPWNEASDCAIKFRDTLKEDYYFNDKEATDFAEDLFGSINQKQYAPATPENIVERMKTSKPQRENRKGSYKDLIKITGTKLKNLDEAREKNYAVVRHHDRNEDIDELETLFNGTNTAILEHQEKNSPTILNKQKINNFVSNIERADVKSLFEVDRDRVKTEMKKLYPEIENINDDQGDQTATIDMKYKEWLEDKIKELGRMPEYLNYEDELNEAERRMYELMFKKNKYSAPQTPQIDLLKSFYKPTGVNPLNFERTMSDYYKPNDNYKTDDPNQLEKRAEEMQKELNKNKNPFYHDIPLELLERYIELVDIGRELTVKFTESKPERVVDLFKEVKAILVPDDIKGGYEKLTEAVKGTPLEGKIHEYTNERGEGSKAKKLKELQDKYGNIFFSIAGTIMPISMLFVMASKLQGDDDDQQQTA